MIRYKSNDIVTYFASSTGDDNNVTQSEVTSVNKGRKRVCIKYHNSTTSYGLTTDTTASEYSPKLNIYNSEFYFGNINSAIVQFSTRQITTTEKYTTINTKTYNTTGCLTNLDNLTYITTYDPEYCSSYTWVETYFYSTYSNTYYSNSIRQLSTCIFKGLVTTAGTTAYQYGSTSVADLFPILYLNNKKMGVILETVSLYQPIASNTSAQSRYDSFKEIGNIGHWTSTNNSSSYTVEVPLIRSPYSISSQITSYYKLYTTFVTSYSNKFDAKLRYNFAGNYYLLPYDIFMKIRGLVPIYYDSAETTYGAWGNNFNYTTYYNNVSTKYRLVNMIGNCGIIDVSTSFAGSKGTQNYSGSLYLTLTKSDYIMTKYNTSANNLANTSSRYVFHDGYRFFVSNGLNKSIEIVAQTDSYISATQYQTYSTYGLTINSLNNSLISSRSGMYSYLQSQTLAHYCSISTTSVYGASLQSYFQPVDSSFMYMTSYIANLTYINSTSHDGLPYTISTIEVSNSNIDKTLTRIQYVYSLPVDIIISDLSSTINTFAKEIMLAFTTKTDCLNDLEEIDYLNTLINKTRFRYCGYVAYTTVTSSSYNNTRYTRTLSSAKYVYPFEDITPVNIEDYIYSNKKVYPHTTTSLYYLSTGSSSSSQNESLMITLSYFSKTISFRYLAGNFTQSVKTSELLHMQIKDFNMIGTLPNNTYIANPNINV